MNLTLRPSGGRGEYELAGRQGDLGPADLFGRPMFLEILPGVAVNAHCNCVLRDGKARIRLTQTGRNAHPSVLIAGALMLPKPRRERNETHGAVVPLWDRFVMQTVRIDVVLRPGGNVLISPLTVRIENGDDVRRDISFAERMARVVRVWTAAAAVNDLADRVAVAVRAHISAFTSATSTQAQLAGALPDLHAALGSPTGDLLPILEARYALGGYARPVGDLSDELDDDDFIEDVGPVSPEEARVERVRQWRLAAARGASSAAFRRDVREAYNSRCMFSGKRLPRTDATATAGVDAAHILPWSLFDLDVTDNGICLSKECHWAFDAGVLRLSHDDTVSRYVVSIPARIPPAALAAGFDLGSFAALVGEVPLDRLPVDAALWPSRVYVGELNRFLDGLAV